MPRHAEFDRNVSVLVDSHKDGVATLALMLGMAGHRVGVAGTGESALAAATDDPPDVVLLELYLPDMNGWDLTRRLRALPAARRPLIVAVTVYGRADDLRRSEEAGIDLHLTKPVDPVDLLAILSRFARLLAPTELVSEGIA